MIIDLDRFITEERASWRELESVLDSMEDDAAFRIDLEEVTRFHYLYQRTSADLVKVKTFSSQPEIRRYLESLVARAYGEIHETREKAHRLSPLQWFLNTLPQTFRRHIAAFWVSAAVTAVGFAFGGFAIGLDPGAKEILIPFGHLRGDPSERVEREESTLEDRLKGGKTHFSAFLMTHNTKVSIFTLAMGITWGIGTILLLFYNGVILGAIALDYVIAGETKFLLGWLLPHGSVEIPAILIAGQAGLVLAGALIGWGTRVPLKTRLRNVLSDVMTLTFGLAILLVWAGIVEAFLSQYHEPVLPYSIKIGFGAIEMVLLFFFLFRSGTRGETSPQAA